VTNASCGWSFITLVEPATTIALVKGELGRPVTKALRPTGHPESADQLNDGYPFRVFDGGRHLG
jgi:hypothetical protein